MAKPFTPENLASLDVLRDVCKGKKTGNEENIKNKIVAPLLEALGYDPVLDLDYERHVGKGRSDIAVLLNDKPVLIVETKGLDKELEDYKQQGLGYALTDGIPWTLLTNGIQWDLYKTSIEGVSVDENEPILTIYNREFPTKFSEFQKYVAKKNISNIHRTAEPEIKYIVRKARASDIVRILHRHRSKLFFEMRDEFEQRYGTETKFTAKVDQWIDEQGVEMDYDWLDVFKDDKKFRAFVVSSLRTKNLINTKEEFEKKYRDKEEPEFTRKVDRILREQGIPIDWKDKLCFEGAYGFINRLLFLKICEDNKLIPREITPDFVAKLRQAESNVVLVARLESGFSAVGEKFPAIYHLPLLDHLELKELTWDPASVADLCDSTIKFDFAELGDVLGDFYQKHVDHNSRRLMGQFFTHEDKVNFILDRVSGWFREDSKVLDPACGSGTFLVGAYKRLEPILLSSGYNKKTAHEHLLRRVLFGVDVDSFASQLSAINLLVRNLAAPTAEMNVYSGNSLRKELALTQFIDSPEAETQDPIHRARKMSDVGQLLKPKSFDIVVANPPFFKIGKKNAVYLPLLNPQSEYKHVRPEGSETNIATLFLKKIVDILTVGGVCGLIMPKSITYVDEFRLVRDYLLSRCQLSCIADLGRGWTDVGLEQVILIFEKKSHEPLPEQQITWATKPVEIVHSVDSFRLGLYEKHVVSAELFYKDPKKRLTIYLYGDARKIYDKLHARGDSLSSYDWKVWEGVRDDQGVNRKAAKTSPKDVPLLAGKNVRRWFTEPTHFVHAGDMKIPPGVKSSCDVDVKIVIKRVLSSKVRIEAVVDRKRAITHSSTTALRFRDGTDHEYICGVLNSRLMNLYVRDWMFNRTELTMNFREEYLGQIPIPKDPHPTIRRKISKLVRDMEALSASPLTGEMRRSDPRPELTLKKNELDRLVYDLYALTATEIKYVEKQMPYSE